MVFSGLIFLYAFLPASLIAYWLCPTLKSKNVILLVFSLLFYGWAEPKYLLLLIAMSGVSWCCALGVEQLAGRGKKAMLILAAVTDVCCIGFFKYAAFLWGICADVPAWVANIALPVGISFYTFQLLTYVVDVYRGEAKAERSFLNVLLYASLFHQCIAGPIVRYGSIAGELFGYRSRTPELAEGVKRFALGLSKKVLFANPCGNLADRLILSTEAIADPALLPANLSALQGLSVLGSWVGIGAYALQIYLDFSAYSDMAIGMGLMLGLHYPENFNYPYISRSVTEFWRRWHMSLGTFFRDYVYIPLGGSREGTWRTIRNTFVVWALTGLWHGASWNFVLWGLWFFLLLMLERFGLRKWLTRIPVVSNLYLLLAVCLGWVIFRFSDVGLAAALAKGMFALNGNALSDLSAVTMLKNNAFLLLAAVIVSTPLLKRLDSGMAALCSRMRISGVWDVITYCILPVALLILSTAALVGDSYNPFLYFQF